MSLHYPIFCCVSRIENKFANKKPFHDKMLNCSYKMRDDLSVKLQENVLFGLHDKLIYCLVIQIKNSYSEGTILMINNLASHLIAFGSNSISVHFLYLSRNSIVQMIIEFYSDILLQTMMIKIYETIKE